MGQTQQRPGIDREWIEKTSRLSRLKLSEEELSELIPQLGQILDHVDRLRAVPTEGVRPFIHPLLELLPDCEAGSLREDSARSEAEAAAGAAPVLECAPELIERAFQVPQAVGGREK